MMGRLCERSPPINPNLVRFPKTQHFPNLLDVGKLIPLVPVSRTSPSEPNRMALRLTLKTPLSLFWESAALRPDALRGQPIAQIAAAPIQVGNRTETLGDWFDIAIEGDAHEERLTIEGDLSHGRGIGQGMASGELLVIGSAGHRLGAAMSGGRIEVQGDVGANAGAEMRGGLLRIRGRAGINLGSALPGGRAGMRGGAIIAHGDVGDDVGFLMRRGMIAVGGSTGDQPGRAMIAGSIFVAGRPGRRAGAFMKRGTLVFLGPPPELAPTFRPSLRYRPPFLTIYLRELANLGFSAPESAFIMEMNQFRGDLAEGGQGEILAFDP